MHHDAERNVAADSKTKRDNDPFLRHYNDRFCRHLRRQVKLLWDSLWRRRGIYAAGVLADSISVAVIKLDK
jgi:hypothetical protein